MALTNGTATLSTVKKIDKSIVKKWSKFQLCIVFLVSCLRNFCLTKLFSNIFSISFILLGLTFIWIQVNFFACKFQIVLVSFVERLSFFSPLPLHLCWNLPIQIRGFISRFFLLFHWSMCLSLHILDYSNFNTSFKVASVSFPTSFFFKVVLNILDSLKNFDLHIQCLNSAWYIEYLLNELINLYVYSSPHPQFLTLRTVNVQETMNKGCWQSLSQNVIFLLKS